MSTVHLRSIPPESVNTSVLLGREAELTLVRSFLGRAASRGGLLVLSGNPGVGKSAIVDVASAMASDLGARVIRVVGTRTELDYNLSGIDQLLLGLRGDLPLRGTPQQETLAVILEQAVAKPGLEAPRVSLALLELLRSLSSDRPVLLAVDDWQWIDRRSTNILRFLAHRVRSCPVGFICASRTGGGSGLTGDWPVVEIASLDEESSAGLVDMHFPALQPSVRRRVLAAARGNPLALIELSKALINSRSDGGPYLGWPLPFTPRLRASVTPDLEHLTPDARRILLLAALEPSGDLQVLQEAAADAGGLGCLDPAEREGLIHVDSAGTRLRFRDPLTRAAVIDMGTHEERRQAHVRLSGLLRDQPDRRARHLAEAALEPQEELAEFLEASARRMLGSGLISTGVSTLLRAARLSEGPSARGRRLARAAYIGANVAGDWRIASDLLTEAQRSDPNLIGSIEAAVALSCLTLNSDGDLDSAARQLLAAIEGATQVRNSHTDMLIGALRALGYICYLGGRPELWAQYQTAVEILPPDITNDIGLCIRCYADPIRASPPDLEVLDRKVDILDDQFDPSQIVLTAVPALHLDRLAGCRPALWRVVESGRQGDAVGSAIEALMLLSLDDFRTGRWDQAEGLALESLALGQANNFQFTAWLGWYSRGMVSAAKGHHESAKSLSNEIVRWALPRGALSVRHCASLVKTLSSLGQGDFEAAYRHATSISPAGQLASFTPQALWAMMDLVEAAVRTGRVREAQAHVDAIRQADIEHLSPRLRLLAEAATALVAPEALAGAIFEGALSIGGVQRWSFDLGRVKLLYGEHLRRTRATLDARSQLSAAQETFECLGAVPWMIRARQELRAAGLSRPSADNRLSAILTPQEYEIARLAASGLTNKEIGTRLYLSHRTVSAHLYRIFPKLGITARAALRDALDDFSDQS